MNKYNPNKHHRRSIRLKGYDYSQAGLYFVTICVQNRTCLFGNISDGEMKLNDAGNMVKNEWLKLPNRFHNIKLHEFVVMSNHFHAILEIVPIDTPHVGATLVVAPNDTVAPNDVVAPNDMNNSKMGQPEMGQPRPEMGQPRPEMGQPRPEKGQPQGIAPTAKTLGEMVGAFESIVTVEYIRGVKNNNWQRFNGKLWQRNYWEHIIRNENEYNRIAQYIIDNPMKWDNDKLNGGSGNIVMEPAVTYGEEKWMT